MNDAEIAARGARAASYRAEFIDPILSGIRKSYSDRIVEVASRELDPKVRSEKLTSLAVAIRILDNIDSGLAAFEQAGDIAQASILQAEKIEKMSAPQRRLLQFAPTY